MSYLVLARKSRPQTFDQVVGQRSVVKTLRNSLQRNRVAHAILFSGVRGVGKTTLARIMAKAINCEAELAHRPCNECTPCREITAGSALDLHEIDGASNRGIQEIRELKEKIKFMPTSCRYKVFIIDEVHMLTTEAFNALLKTLEEPPDHVHFMFATTELHKIPITILSRCQQYELKRIPADELFAHFNSLAQAEDITIEPAALSLIVREAEGSVRDGLSLLDQVFSFGEQHITSEDVIEVLGLVDRDVLLSLTSGLLQGDQGSALQALKTIYDHGMDIKRFSSDLLECYRVLLLTRIDGCLPLIDLPADDLKRYSALAMGVSAETIQLQLNLLMKLVEEVRYSSQPRLALETGFLRIIEAGNVTPVSQLLGKIDALLDTTASNIPATGSSAPSPSSKQEQPKVYEKKKTATEDDQKTVAPPPQPAPTPPEPPLPEEPPFPVAEEITQVEAEETAGPVTETESPTAPEGKNEKLTAEQHPHPPVVIHPHEKDIRKHWPDFIAYVKERVIWMAQDLNRAKVKEVDGELHLHYDDPAECSLLKQRDNRNQLTEFVLDFFQKVLTVQFILPSSEDLDDSGGGDSPHKKRQQLANDPLTIMTAEIFHGQIGDIRIGPRSR